MTSDALHQRLLDRNWLIQTTDIAAGGGQDISGPGFDTRNWIVASVPSTVLGSLVAAGCIEDPYFGKNLQAISVEPFQCPWWYRTEFELSEGEAAQTVLLGFDGINYAGDVWVNGRQIASADEARGAFRRFRFDISQRVTPGRNVLAVEVAPPQPGDFSTGFVDWNPAPPDRNMGLFRPARLRFCHGVSIESPFVQTRLNLETLAEADLTVSVDLENHRSEPVAGVLDVRIEEARVDAEVHLSPNETRTIVLGPGQHSQLRLAEPRIWWPYELGEPELYKAEFRFVADGQVTDAASIRFGVREVGDHWTDEGHRGFTVNGRKVLIKGAGWTDDLLLADTPERVEAQLRYVRHIGLNGIRCEGLWGTDQTLYDLCDEYGILMMVGWSCHWEHEQYLGKPVDERYGGIVAPEDIELIARSWEDQLLWLRHHPSILVWAVASDKVPAPDLERRYIEIFQRCDPTRPYLASTGGVGSEQRIIGSEEIVSDVSGGSGVKMLGPYAYTPPVYWYTDTQRGGAYGFNTETSPGAVVPTLESLKRMLPPDHLWPIDDYWDFHCGLYEFDTLDRYVEALGRRYGDPESLEEFARKAQMLSYELMRPMFEAFRVNRGRATGVVQWMLNAAWPKMYWQLYDWYLVPTGAFYAARKACASPQLVYHYGDDGIYLVNDRLDDIAGLRAEMRVLDIESRLFLATHFAVDATRERAALICTLPPFENISTTFFLDLRLTDKHGAQVADNFYWLSTQPDVLDYEAKVEPWEFYTPSKNYADFTQLNSLGPAEVVVEREVRAGDRETEVAVTLENRGDGVAFFVELLVVDEGGRPIAPVLWQDNYVSLLPEDRTTRTVTYPSHRPASALVVRGLNVAEQRYSLQPGR